MPEVPWDAHQAYLDLNRPAIHVMRKLKAEGRLTGPALAYMAGSKPPEELYDLEKDPMQLNNLAGNPEYAGVLKRMRGLEQDWQSKHRDFGLEDFGKRVPEQNMASVAVLKAVAKKNPDLLKRLQAGELMETQSWKKYRPKKK